MKAFILLTILFVILGFSTSTAQPIRIYGLKVGYVKAEQQWNYTQQSGLNASGISPLWGVDAGAFVEFFDFPNFSLLTEVRWIQKGRTVKWEVLELPVPDEPWNSPTYRTQVDLYRFDYISIPILAKLRMDGPKFSPFVAAGPSFEYLISIPSDINQYNKTEFAFMLSAGVELTVPSTQKIKYFDLECRYSIGLTNTLKKESVTVNTRVLEFLIGVAF